jgi:hypothetical protein
MAFVVVGIVEGPQAVRTAGQNGSSQGVVAGLSEEVAIISSATLRCNLGPMMLRAR